MPSESSQGYTLNSLSHEWPKPKVLCGVRIGVGSFIMSGDVFAPQIELPIGIIVTIEKLPDGSYSVMGNVKTEAQYDK